MESKPSIDSAPPIPASSQVPATRFKILMLMAATVVVASIMAVRVGLYVLFFFYMFLVGLFGPIWTQATLQDGPLSNILFILGWSIYIVLAILMFRMKTRRKFIIVCCIILLMLVLNIFGCTTLVNNMRPIG